MRCWTCAAGMILMVMAPTGCAAPRHPQFTGVHPALLMVDAADQCMTAPLFDRHPGSICAESFNWRSDWPSTFGYYSAGQVTTFHEYLNDYQGGSQGNWDHTYRRSSTRRYSLSFR